MQVVMRSKLDRSECLVGYVPQWDQRVLFVLTAVAVLHEISSLPYEEHRCGQRLGSVFFVVESVCL